MYPIVSIVFLATLLGAFQAEFCLPTEYEASSFVALSLEDWYIAASYTRGRIFSAPKDAVDDLSAFTVMDFPTNKLYSKANGKCTVIDFPVQQMYGQCMPSDTKVLSQVGYNNGSLVVSYEIMTFKFSTVIQKVPGTDFIIPTITRTYLGDELLEVNVHYDNVLGVTDPSVFELDLSGCVAPPPAQSS